MDSDILYAYLSDPRLPPPRPEDLARVPRFKQMIRPGLEAIKHHRDEIIAHHAAKRRCYVYVLLRVRNNEPHVIREEVMTDFSIPTVAGDARFREYVATYDMSYMVPFFVKQVNSINYEAMVIPLPWLVEAALKRAREKKAKEDEKASPKEEKVSPPHANASPANKKEPNSSLPKGEVFQVMD